MMLVALLGTEGTPCFFLQSPSVYFERISTVFAFTHRQGFRIAMVMPHMIAHNKLLQIGETVIVANLVLVVNVKV